MALEHVVETHTGGGVQRLAEHGGGHAGKERGDALRLDDPDADGYRTGRRRRWHWSGRVKRKRRAEDVRFLKLHANFDEVEWVGGATCNDGSNATFKKPFYSHAELERK